MNGIDDMLTSISRDVARHVAMGIAFATLLLVAVLVIYVALTIGSHDAASSNGGS